MLLPALPAPLTVTASTRTTVRGEIAPRNSYDQQSAPGSGATTQIIVRLRPSKTQPDAWSSLANQVVRVLGRLPQVGAILLEVPTGARQSILEELRRQPQVEYAEPNYLANASIVQPVDSLQIPNDELWPQQWALPLIHAPEAWDITHTQNVIIAVLDTGVYVDHPDLHGILWTNPGEIPANGRDDDGNGRVDDIHGWHFYQDCSTGICQPSQNRLISDDNGHGTHVAGIAAAQTNNVAGVAGVSWGARVMTVKVLDQFGDGYYYDIAAGIVYAADNGAQIINLSLGGEAYSQLLQDAVDYAYGKGVLIIAASGNNGGAVFFPGACANVLTVAATDQNEQRLEFSNQGPEVDIAAPGDYMISTWIPPYLYYIRRGTSMATPHVSGAAALLWTWRPDWTNAQIAQRLQTQADDVNATLYPGYDPFIGWGRLNLFRALEGLAQGPTPTPTLTPVATATMPDPTPTHPAIPTETRTPTLSPSTTATSSQTPTATLSPTPTAMATVSPTAMATVSPTAMATPLPTFRIFLPDYSS